MDDKWILTNLNLNGYVSYFHQNKYIIDFSFFKDDFASEKIKKLYHNKKKEMGQLYIVQERQNITRDAKKKAFKRRFYCG